MGIIVGLFQYIVLCVLVIAVLYFIVRWIAKNIKIIAVCALVVALGLAAIVFVPRLARGEEATETRRIEVVDFDFYSAEVVLEDEDGYQWTCPFGPFNWAIGEEYVLEIFTDHIEIKEVEDGCTSLQQSLRWSSLF